MPAAHSAGSRGVRIQPVTTSVFMALGGRRFDHGRRPPVRLGTGCARYPGFVNPQVRYGEDLMSRVVTPFQKPRDGALEPGSSTLMNYLKMHCCSWPDPRTSDVVVVGNTIIPSCWGFNSKNWRCAFALAVDSSVKSVISRIASAARTPCHSSLAVGRTRCRTAASGPMIG
jgi:hypothetical protein